MRSLYYVIWELTGRTDPITQRKKTKKERKKMKDEKETKRLMRGRETKERKGNGK